MSLPVGVSFCRVTCGTTLGLIDGKPALLTVKVTPVWTGSAVGIVHVASGWALGSFTATYRAIDGGGITFDAPHVDQTGFKDSDGNDFTMWAYNAEITARLDGQVRRWRKGFQPLVGAMLPT